MLTPEPTRVESGVLHPSGPWTLPSPEHVPHRGALLVDETARSGLIAAQAEDVVLEYEVREGLVLHIAEVGFDASNPIALSNATWKMMRNTVPVPGFKPRPTTVGTIRRPSKLDAWVEGPAKIQIIVTNNSPGSAWRYFARIAGHLFVPYGVKS